MNVKNEYTTLYSQISRYEDLKLIAILSKVHSEVKKLP
jgi:hypothetical protein